MKICTYAAILFIAQCFAVSTVHGEYSSPPFEVIEIRVDNCDRAKSITTGSLVRISAIDRLSKGETISFSGKIVEITDEGECKAKIILSAKDLREMSILNRTHESKYIIEETHERID